MKLSRILFIGAGALVVVWASALFMQPTATPAPGAAGSSVVPPPSPMTATAPSQEQPDSKFDLERLTDFKTLSRETLAKLPRKADLRNLSDEEVHETPAPVQAAGVELGRIAGELDRNPALKEAAAEFYIACAEESEFLNSVRALCYSHLPKLLEPSKLVSLRVSSRVRDLAQKLASPDHGI